MPAWFVVFLALLTYTASAQETQQIRLARETDSLIRKVIRQDQSVEIPIVIELTAAGISDNVQSVSLSGIYPFGILVARGSINNTFTNNQVAFVLRAQGSFVGRYADTITFSSTTTQIHVVIDVNVIPSSQIWTVSPDVIDFGPLLPHTSLTRHITIGNASDSVLRVWSSAIQHPFYSSMLSVEIPSNDVVEIAITCSPDSTDVAPLTTDMTLLLSHLSTDSQVIQLRLMAASDQLAVDLPDSISAGPNNVANQNVVRSFILRNAGKLDISRLEVTRFTGPADVWQVDSTTINTGILTPGDSISVTIVGRTDGSGLARRAVFNVLGGNDTIQEILGSFTIGFDDPIGIERFVFSQDTFYFGPNNLAGSESVRSIIIHHNAVEGAVIMDYVLLGSDAANFILPVTPLPKTLSDSESDTILIRGIQSGVGQLRAVLIVSGSCQGDTALLVFNPPQQAPRQRDTVHVRLPQLDLRIGQRATVYVTTDSSLSSVSSISSLRVSFDGTVVIAVQGSEPVSPGRRGRWIDVTSGPWISGDTIAQFDIIAALGVTDMSDLTIDSAILRTDDGDTIESTFSSGRVDVTDARGYHVNSTASVTYMSVSPNPATETTTLTYTSDEEYRRLRLFNTLSNVVKDYTSHLSTGSGTVVLDVADLPAGFYLLRLDTRTSSYALQLAVQ